MFMSLKIKQGAVTVVGIALACSVAAVCGAGIWMLSEIAADSSSGKQEREIVYSSLPCAKASAEVEVRGGWSSSDGGDSYHANLARGVVESHSGVDYNMDGDTLDDIEAEYTASGGGIVSVFNGSFPPVSTQNRIYTEALIGKSAINPKKFVNGMPVDKSSSEIASETIALLDKSEFYVFISERYLCWFVARWGSY